MPKKPKARTHDEAIRLFLESARRTKHIIIPMIIAGKKQYLVVRADADGNVVSEHNPILEGDWLDDFPRRLKDGSICYATFNTRGINKARLTVTPVVWECQSYES